MADTKQLNNIDLNISTKVRYTINGNEDMFIELNPGDMGITARLGEAIPKLNTLSARYESLVPSEDEDVSTDESLTKFGEQFSAIDSEMRQIVNELFDYDVCSVCANGGSMLDLQDGEYRFSVIVNTLLTLYEETISEEIDKLTKKMKKRTDKYTTKDHQRRSKN